VCVCVLFIGPRRHVPLVGGSERSDESEPVLTIPPTVVQVGCAAELCTVHAVHLEVPGNTLCAFVKVRVSVNIACKDEEAAASIITCITWRRMCTRLYKLLAAGVKLSHLQNE
jgi:hypothetical protein